MRCDAIEKAVVAAQHSFDSVVCNLHPRRADQRVANPLLSHLDIRPFPVVLSLAALLNHGCTAACLANIHTFCGWMLCVETQMEESDVQLLLLGKLCKGSLDLPKWVASRVDRDFKIDQDKIAGFQDAARTKREKRKRRAGGKGKGSSKKKGSGSSSSKAKSSSRQASVPSLCGGYSRRSSQVECCFSSSSLVCVFCVLGLGVFSRHICFFTSSLLPPPFRLARSSPASIFCASST